MIKVGVIGSGSMGIGIAQVAANAGHEVVLFDTNQQAVEKAMNKLQKILVRLVEKGKIEESTSVEILERISPASSLIEMKDLELLLRQSSRT